MEELCILGSAAYGEGLTRSPWGLYRNLERQNRRGAVASEVKPGKEHGGKNIGVSSFYFSLVVSLSLSAWISVKV